MGSKSQKDKINMPLYSISTQLVRILQSNGGVLFLFFWAVPYAACGILVL